MKIKKIISLVVASVMIASSIPMMSVQAADEAVNNNLVMYTPVTGIQEIPTDNMFTNGGIDSYVVDESQASGKNFGPWWSGGDNGAQAEFTGEDSVSEALSEVTNQVEGYSYKVDMSKLPADGFAILGTSVYIAEFAPEQSLKFTFYMKCIGDSAAPEQSSITTYLMPDEADRTKDTTLNDPNLGYSHLTPGVQDGWVRVDVYIGKDSIKQFGPAQYHLFVNKGPDREADNIYLFDGISLTLVNNEDIPQLEITEEEKPFFAFDKITPTTKKIQGNHKFDGSTVTVKAGSKVLGSTEVVAKSFVVPIKAQKPGTKISITFTKAGYADYTETFVVGLPKIKVNKVTSKSKKITGKAYAKAKITVKAGKKVVAKGKAKANGKFSLKLKKVKKKTTLKITAKLGAATATASYKVKK